MTILLNLYRRTELWQLRLIEYALSSQPFSREES